MSWIRGIVQGSGTRPSQAINPKAFHHGRSWAGIDQPTPSEIKMDDPWAKAETKPVRRPKEQARNE